MNRIFDGTAFIPKKNGSSKTGQGITVNGMISTPQRQTQTNFKRQEHSSCFSSASCPVFTTWQSNSEEEPAPHCACSISSPTLQGSLTNLHESESTPSYKDSQTTLKNSVITLQNSFPSLDGAVSTFRDSSTSSVLQSTKQSLCGSVTSLRSSSTNYRSSSSSLQSGNSSEDDSWDTNSWSSGATCLLRSSIKQHSEEVFRVRASSSSRPKPKNDSETGYQNVEVCRRLEQKPESKKISEKAAVQRKDSLQSQTSTHSSSITSGTSAHIEEKIEAKLKFSKFLDEVTCRVLDPESLQAFGVLHQKKVHVPTLQLPLVNCSYSTPLSCDHSTQPSHQVRLNWDAAPTSSESKKTPVNQWKKNIPSCRILDSTETHMWVHKETRLMDQHRRTYLKTDTDSVQQKDDFNCRGARNVKNKPSRKDTKRRVCWICSKPSPNKYSGKTCPSVVSDFSDSHLGVYYPSTTPPRTVNSKLACAGETHAISVLQKQKEDLQRQLSYTNHKLEMLMSEFNSTKQYLETELRRAQEELEKFTDKLCRIQSGYAALQRINQELKDKIHRMEQQHEAEKRKLNREIIVLNNHLMEANITIETLRENNRPIDFKERLSSFTAKKGIGTRTGLCHSLYPDPVPTTINGKILSKPESGSSCPVTRSPSPQPQEQIFVAKDGKNSVDSLQHHVGYKTFDLYCSDTALYCPTDERRQGCWQEHGQSGDFHGRATSILTAQNSTDSNPEEDNFHPRFAHSDTLLHGFAAGSTRASSSYSSFTLASDEKGYAPGSTLSPAHLALYSDWREGDYAQKDISLGAKDSPMFPKLHSFQHRTPSMQNDTSSVYSQTASCYSEPHNPPRLSSSQSMGSSGVLRESGTSIHVPEEDPTGHWRQLSVEDINTFSYCNSGHVSPYSFSEQHFAVGPANIKLDPLYSSFPERNSNFHKGIPDPCLPSSPFSSLTPSPKHSMGVCKTENTLTCKSKNLGPTSQESRTNFLPARSTKENMSTVGRVNGKEYVNASLKSSAESLHQNLLEVANVQHYQLQSPRPQKKTSPQHQKIGSTGLSRKDSLTKAQLYGTLLN